jgi:hypothetical protein
VIWRPDRISMPRPYQGSRGPALRVNP